MFEFFDLVMQASAPSSALVERLEHWQKKRERISTRGNNGESTRLEMDFSKVALETK
jgi:hypothetical protein